MNRDLKRLKRLERLIADWKADKNQFPFVIRTINDEGLWKLVANSMPEFLALEFGIPEGRGFLITTGEVVPF